MKINHILSISCTAAVLVLSSCSDSFLEVTPPTQNPIEEYYTTQDHVYEALVAAYDPLHWTDWGQGEYNPINIMADIMADDIWVGGANKTDNQPWHLMMNYEATPNNCITALWTDEYSGVKRCNDVIQFISWAKAAGNMTDENEKSWTAQARVLRAYYYNNLWKFWGSIPFYMTNPEPPYLSPQKTADEVYEAVITDLESVIDEKALPMAWSDQGDESNVGKVSQAMASMLYTEMVMYQNDESRYGKALGYMRNIINSNQYKLMDNYADIWKETGEWSSESIFEVNYKDDNAVRSWSGPLVAGGTVLPRLISPSSFKDTSNSGLDNGWGFCPVRLETYQRYLEGDTRRDVTCLDVRKYGTYDARYQDTGYFLGKYIAYKDNNKDQKADADLNFNNNLRVYRYAETLLNAAELILRTGGDTKEAETYLNMVHHRAGLVQSVAATIDNVIAERQLEFVGEGKRYWDLVRSGKAQTTLVPDKYGYRTNTWSPARKYLPIPQKEIDAAQGTLKNTNY